MIYASQRVALKTLAHMENEIERMAIQLGRLQDLLAEGLTDEEISQLHSEILLEESGVKS